MAGILALFLALCILYFGGRELIKILRGRKARILVVPISLAFTIGMLVELGEMERTRSIMMEITGPDFQDNQWGFGQVIALFLWMPLCIQLGYYAVCESFLHSRLLPANNFP